MIVVCPHCLKRYMLDDNLLPQEGRQVRCLSCHHIWRQIPDLPSLINPPSSLKGTIDMAVEPAFSSEKQNGWVGWMIFLTVFITLFYFLSFERDWVVKLWPPSERLYELVGLQVTPSGAGLSLINTTSLIQQDGSTEMIRVVGDITNTTDRMRPIPPLKIKLMGATSHPKCLTLSEKECVLDYWEHRLSENSLLPGEKIHFETEPRPKVSGTQHISVEF